MKLSNTDKKHRVILHRRTEFWTAILVCSCPLAMADTPLQDSLCSTGLTALCQNPAPSVSSLTYNPTWGRLTVTIDGVQYVSAPYSATAEGGTVYAADGTWKEVTTVFATWITRSGRNTVTHWELKGGTVQ